MNVWIYVEGGGTQNKALGTRCRQGFSQFFQKAGLNPRIVECGGRSRAYDRFCTFVRNARTDDFPLLLVDSEGPVTLQNPWEHVRSRREDQWIRPEDASGEHLHFMVQAMEAWFFADQAKIQNFYKHGFRPRVLTQRRNIEEIPKADLFSQLELATRDCQKGDYSKGDHSFQILGMIDPARVRLASPVHAERLFTVLEAKCNSG